MFIDSEPFQAGFTAANIGVAIETNPYAFEAQPRKLWDCGHTLATLLNNEAGLNAEPLEHVSANPLAQGQAAFIKGVELSDNPYGFGDPNGTSEEKATYQAHSEWEQGWVINKQLSDSKPHVAIADEQPKQTQATGGNVSYYLVHVPFPKRGGPAYTFEVEDVIEFAQMTFDEGCELKGIIRTANARLGAAKPDHDPVYDAEKRVHYANRSLVTERRKALNTDIDRIAPI